MNRIKEILKAKGVTQQGLADMLGVTKISVAKTLTGNPTRQTLEKIATALDVPMWQLFASPEEVGRAISKGPRVRCPHCGEEIPVHIDIRTD